MKKRTFASFMLVAVLFALAAPENFGQDRRRRRLGSRARAIMTAGAGTGIGAGIGALAGGRRGAAAGALLGGGGATAAWLLANPNSRRRLGRYGQPIATIGSGTAIGAGVGALAGGRRGAGIGALLGGGGTTAAYLLTHRNRNSSRPMYATNGYNATGARSYYQPVSSRRRVARRRCRC